MDEAIAVHANMDKTPGTRAEERFTDRFFPELLNFLTHPTFADDPIAVECDNNNDEAWQKAKLQLDIWRAGRMKDND